MEEGHAHSLRTMEKRNGGPCSCPLPSSRIRPPPRLHRVSKPRTSAEEPRGRVESAGTGTMMPLRPVSCPMVYPDPAPVEAPAPPVPAPAAAPAAVPAPAAAPQAPAQGQGNAGPNAPPGVLMRAPIRGRLVARLVQVLLAAAAVAAMVSARDFASLTAFRYLVSAAALQCLWSLALTILYFYALLVGRSYRTPRAIAILCVGDWITGGLTFTAACASAGITTFISDDVEGCHENHCPSFMAATAMAFLSWFTVAPCCLLNLGMVIYKLQRQ